MRHLVSRLAAVLAVSIALAATTIGLGLGVAGAEPGFSPYQTLPVPIGVSVSTARYPSVSCPTTTSCTAVGSSTWGDPWATTLSSGSWSTPVPLPMPAGAVHGTVSVTCVGAGDCLAAGDEVTSDGGTLPVVVEESSGTWGVGTSFALPADALSGASANASLGAPWCSSPGNCVVVGTYKNGANSWSAMSAVETAGVWGALTALPGDETGYTPPASLTCTDVGDCTAVAGSSAWTETAGTWTSPTSLATSLNEYETLTLSGIGCPSASTCLAVGTLEDSGPCQCRPSSYGVSIPETDGTWGAPVDLAVIGLSQAEDIACQPGQCVAVSDGYSDNDNASYTIPIANTWSGSAWSSAEELFSLRAGYREASSLNAVSCATTTQCVAVGEYAWFGPNGGPDPQFPYAADITPVRPVTAPSAPAGARATPGLGRVLVSWRPSVDDGGSPLTAYVATANPGGASCTTGGTGSACTITGLANGTRYRVVVTASNGTDVSVGAATNAVMPGARPGAPGDVLVEQSGTKATFHWAPASHPVGEPVLRYTVCLHHAGETLCAATKATSVTIGGLRPGSTYGVVSRAWDASGPSKPVVGLFTPTTT